MALPPFDLCRNSHFITDKQVAPVLAELQTLFDAVHDRAARLDVPVAVLIGGSLARREPSVRFAGGKPTALESDADFFVLVPDAGQISHAAALERDTAGISPAIDRSFHFAPLTASQKGHMGQSALSVVYGLDYPIYAPMALPRPANPVADPVDGLEVLIHRLVTVAIDRHVTTHLLTGGVAPLTPEGRRSAVLKLVLAGIEAQYYGKIPEAAGIHPSVRLAKDGLFDGLIDTDTLMGFIRAREIFELGGPLPPIDLGAFARTAIARQFDAPDGLGLDGLLQQMTERRYPYEILPRRVGVALAAYSLASIGNEREQEAPIVSHWLRSLDDPALDAPVIEARDRLLAMLDRSPDEAFSSVDAFEAAGVLMTYVQRDVTRRAVGG